MSKTNFVKERDKAFTAAVLHDDWVSVRKFALKQGLKTPKDKTILKAAVYKAVQECTDIPKEVKNEALYKCLKLGFMPFINIKRECEADESICTETNVESRGDTDN